MINELNTWDRTINESITTPNEMIKFFNEIEDLCKKYDLSISHEDGHGSFIIERYSEENIEWLKSAIKEYK